MSLAEGRYMDHIPQNTELKTITLIPLDNFRADSLQATQVKNEKKSQIHVSAWVWKSEYGSETEGTLCSYCVPKLSSLDRKQFCFFAGASKIRDELEKQTNYPSIPYPFPVLANARHFRQRQLYTQYFPRGRLQLQFTCLALSIGNQIIIVLHFIFCPSN